MKIVTGIFMAIIVALVISFVPIMEAPYTETVQYQDTETYYDTEPLSYQVTNFVNKEQVDTRSTLTPSQILSAFAFSKDPGEIQKGLQWAYPPTPPIEYPICRVIVQNTDMVSGIFTVDFTFYLPEGEDTKEVTFELVPDELGMASYEAKGVNFDKDEWSWEYGVTPDTKTIAKERTVTKERTEIRYKRVPIFEYLLHYQ